MTEIEMTCVQFEARLAEYMEGDMSGAERAAMDAHAERCAVCGALVADLRGIVADAARLPAIEPPASVWAGIESRIGATVVPIATRRRSIPLVRALSAAAAMILVTATVTYMATVRMHQTPVPTDRTAQPTTIAQLPPTTAQQPTGNVDSGSAPSQNDMPNTSSTVRVARGVPDAASGSVRTVSHEDRTRSRTATAASVYDEEIARLRSVLKRREDLDPKTIATIQRSLAVIDTAITQARAAVAADPASAFLNKRLAEAQTKKVELLRTAAMLPST